MSINIWTDSMQHAALLGKPVLFTNWLIQRDIIPDGWYCYDLRGTHKSPSTRTTLVDHAADYHAGTVLSPIPLKHEGNLANRFVGELMEQLVQDGLLVTTKTRNGPGVRTATDAEISSPLPGQQQMTL